MRISSHSEGPNLEQSINDKCLHLNPETLAADPTGSSNFARQTLDRSHIQSSETNSHPELPHHKHKKYPEVFTYFPKQPQASVANLNHAASVS